MSALTFDTIQYVDALVEAGVPEQQAKAQSQALKIVIDDTLGYELATKADLKSTGAELKEEIKDLGIRLIKWTVSLHAITIGLVVALIKLL